MGQQMLKRDYVKQAQTKEYIHNGLENKFQELGLSRYYTYVFIS